MNDGMGRKYYFGGDCYALAVMLLLSFYGTVLAMSVLDDPSVRIVSIKADNLHLWYDEITMCMLNDIYDPLMKVKLNLTYYESLQWCEVNRTKVPNNPFNALKKRMCDDALCSLPSSTFANKVRGWCCTEDIPLSQRGFDLVVEGFDKPLEKPVLDILALLSQRNMSIVFLGDSMNGQMYWAFEQERRREEIVRGFESRSSILHSEPIEKLWWASDQVMTLYGISKHALKHVSSRFVWYPESFGNRVFIYSISSNDLGSPDDENLIHSVLPFIARFEHPGGLYIVGNIGHHLANTRLNPDKNVLFTKFSRVLQDLEFVANSNPKNVVAFRETTPAHFNSPQRDGSYEKWGISINKDRDGNYLSTNSWDSTLYYCRDILNISSHSSHIPENDMVKVLLDLWGNPKIKLIPVFRYLAHFSKMKYGYCGGSSRIDILDCVHFCAFSPPMWFPIWFHMHDLLKDNTTVGQGSVLHEFLPVKNVSVSSVLVNNRTGDMYRFQYGLLIKIKNATELHLKDSTIKVDEKLLSVLPNDGSFKVYKESHWYRNETLIKIPHSKEIQVILTYDNRTFHRRSIPTFDTFVAMKYDLGKVIAITTEEMNSIEEGPILPVIYS